VDDVTGIPLLHAYPLAVTIPQSPEHYDVQGHLNNVQAIELFQLLRVLYMGRIVGRRRIGLVAKDHVVGVRELVASYVTQAHPGEQLFGGCRMLGRSTRAWLFDEVIVTADRLVARCRVVECAIKDGRAVPVPKAFWEVIEEAEGRAMPIGDLPIGRTPWDAG
jgi:acyl-CoA thioesterase FadM